MKKVGKILLLFVLSMLITALVCAIPSAAEETAEVTDPTAPINVWKITHADGTVEYTEKFNSFKPFQEGDIYEFLPEYYVIDKDEYASINVNVNVTFDFRGSIIVAYEEGHNNDSLNAQMISINSATHSTATFLMEDAEIHGAKMGRCVFSTGGSAIVVMDGGARGGKVYGGSPINFGNTYSIPDTWSVIKNMYLYKSSPNMQGGLGIRGGSRVRVIDSYVFGSEKHNNPIYVMNTGKVSFENSKLGKLGGSDVINFNTSDAAEVIIGTGTYVYGKISGLKGDAKLTIRHGAYFSHDITSYVDTSEYYYSTVPTTFKETLVTSTSANVLEIGDYEFACGYSVYEKYTEESVKDSHIWEFTAEDGTVTYSNNATALTVAAKKYVKAKLLKDITVGEGILINVSGDFELDLSVASISAQNILGVGNFAIVRGTGDLTVKLGEKSANIPFGLIYADMDGDVNVISSGAHIARTVVYATNGSVSVEGGTYAASSVAFASKNASLSLKNATVSGNAICALVYSSGDMTVDNSVVLADSVEAVDTDGKLTLNDSVYLYGTVKADDFASRDACYFLYSPIIENSDVIIVNEELVKSIKIASVNEGAVALTDKEYTFVYKTEAYVLLDAQDSNSIWKIGFADGSFKYSKHLYVPFGYLEEYVSLTLLKDISVDQSFNTKLSGDFTVDLSGRKISKSMSFPSDKAIISASGMGKLTVKMENAVINADGVAFISADNLRNVDIIATDAYVLVSTVINSKSTPASVNGGYYDTKAGNSFIFDDEALSLGALTVFSSGTVPLVNSASDVTLNEGVKLVTKTGLVAINTEATVYMASGTLITGTIKAASVITEGTSYFGNKLSVDNVNMIVINDRYLADIKLLTYKNGKVTESTANYQFLYRTAVLGEGIKVNASLYTDASLNVYVPYSVTKSNDLFKVRISIDGLLYEADAKDGVKLLVDGTSYVKFTYKYLYPSLYDKKIELTLVSGTFVNKSTMSVSSVLEGGFDAAGEDEAMKTTIASYCAYSMALSGHNIPMREDMAQYRMGYYRSEPADTAFLEEYFSYVKYDVENNKLVLVRREDNTAKFDFYYTFGTETITVNCAETDAVEIPIFRLDHSSPIKVNVKNGSKTESVELDIHSFVWFAKNDTDARRFLELYCAYLRTI